jgi:ABC-type glycerol-3-phosphate transport system substrate-binding protein
MNKQKLWTWPIVLIVIIVMVAGCTTPAPVEPQVITQVVREEVIKEVVVTATPEPKPEGAVTVIRLGSGDSGEGLNPHQQIIANFEKENPDIIVQLEAVAYGDHLLSGTKDFY